MLTKNRNTLVLKLANGAPSSGLPLLQPAYGGPPLPAPPLTADCLAWAWLCNEHPSPKDASSLLTPGVGWLQRARGTTPLAPWKR